MFGQITDGLAMERLAMEILDAASSTPGLTPGANFGSDAFSCVTRTIGSRFPDRVGDKAEKSQPRQKSALSSIIAEDIQTRGTERSVGIQSAVPDSCKAWVSTGCTDAQDPAPGVGGSCEGKAAWKSAAPLHTQTNPHHSHDASGISQSRSQPL